MALSKSVFGSMYVPTFSSSMSWDIFPSTGTHRRWVGGADLLFQVVAARYETGSIVITTNRKFRDWGKTFDVDNTLASAMIDRLTPWDKLFTRIHFVGGIILRG